MRRRFPWFAALLLATALTPGPARSCSMCQCGDPSYRLAGDDFFASRVWRFSFDADRYGKDQVAEDSPGREHERETRLTLAGTWSPVDWLRAVGRVPVVQRRITTPTDAAGLTGLADPEFSMHARIAGARHDWIGVMAGLRAPLGSNERTVAGVRADEHLQPGAGAAAGSAGVAAARDIGQATHLYASTLLRLAGTNAHGYRYGRAWLGTLSLQRDFARRIAGGLELDARDARADRQDGQRVDNTGGTVVYFAPRVQAGLGASFVLKLGVQIPVAQHLLGDQNEHVNLLSGLSLIY